MRCDSVHHILHDLNMPPGQHTQATQRAAIQSLVLDDIGYYHLFVLQYFDVKSSKAAP